MVPGRPQAVGLGHQCVKGRMTGLQGERRIARAEPRLVEVVRLGGQSRARLDQGLSHLAGRGVATSGANRASLFDEEPYASFVESAIVDPDVTRKISGGGECQGRLGCPTTGSWVEYVLPFRLQITAFSFGFSNCGAEDFKDWAFEAFDGEEWRQIYYNRYGPWPEARWDSNELAQPVIFRRLGDAGASSRFRIRLAESNEEERCMHIRGLELYGTIIPPWRID